MIFAGEILLAGAMTREELPLQAAYIASDAEVFPVDEQANTFFPKDNPCDTAAAIPLSLKEPLGFSLCALSLNSLIPAYAAQACDRYNPVFPSPLVVNAFSGNSGAISSLYLHTPLP
ncbi:hypothetical protein D3C77_578210 [compost metagenome]